MQQTHRTETKNPTTGHRPGEHWRRERPRGEPRMPTGSAHGHTRKHHCLASSANPFAARSRGGRGGRGIGKRRQEELSTFCLKPLADSYCTPYSCYQSARRASHTCSRHTAQKLKTPHPTPWPSQRRENQAKTTLKAHKEKQDRAELATFQSNQVPASHARGGGTPRKGKGRGHQPRRHEEGTPEPAGWFYVPKRRDGPPKHNERDMRAKQGTETSSSTTELN